MNRLGIIKGIAVGATSWSRLSIVALVDKILAAKRKGLKKRWFALKRSWIEKSLSCMVYSQSGLRELNKPVGIQARWCEEPHVFLTIETCGLQ